MIHAQFCYIDFNKPCTARIIDVGNYDSNDETISFIIYDSNCGTRRRWFFCYSQSYKSSYKHNALVLNGIRYEPKEDETAAEFMDRIRIPLHNAMMLDIIDT